MANAKIWFEAIRPKTLPAGAAPVIIGVSLSYLFGYFLLLPAIVTLVCALMIQILTNLINEIYDFKRGADTQDRVGPTRAVASGIITVELMKNIAIILALFTFILGLYLVYVAGYEILLIGIVSLLFAYLYTGGPYPLAYKGLGDLFVFIFFGLVAVSGTYYIQTGTVDEFSVIAAIAPGLISANILAVNNIRDIETDRKANKRTLAVRLGRRISIAVFSTVNYLAFASHAVLVYLLFDAGYRNSYFLLLPLILFPMSINNLKSLRSKTESELNPLLAATGKLLFLYSILFLIGIFLMTNF